MSRWLVILGAVVLVLLAFLWWKMSEDPAEPSAQVSNQGKSPTSEDTGPERVARDSGPDPVWVDPASKTAASGDGDGDGDTELIDPKSETFNHRVDVVVGDKLRAAAAFDCDESGMKPNAALKLNYRLRIINGRITVSDVRVMQSEVTPAYERCFVDKVEGTTFRMDDMPDFEEADQELFTRVRTMKKYRSRAEFDE